MPFVHKKYELLVSSCTSIYYFGRLFCRILGCHGTYQYLCLEGMQTMSSIKNILSQKQIFHPWSWCYKTFFWGNLDFEKLNKVCSGDWTCTKMLRQCYFKLHSIRTLLICSKMAYSCCFSFGRNLDFLDSRSSRFPPKKVLLHRLLV